MCFYCIFSWRIPIKRRRHKVQKMIILYSVIFFYSGVVVVLFTLADHLSASFFLIRKSESARFCHHSPESKCSLFNVHCLVFRFVLFSISDTTNNVHFCKLILSIDQDGPCNRFHVSISKLVLAPALIQCQYLTVNHRIDPNFVICKWEEEKRK